MKLFIFLFAFMMHFPLDGNSIYDIQVRSIDGTIISMSSFKGKKIVIGAFHADKPNKSELLFLDSLQQANTDLVVIAMPSIDSGHVSTVQKLQSIKDSIAIHITMINPGLVAKSSDASQSALFQWLTNVSQNSHFDIDWEADEQLFVINGQGTLYAVLMNGTPLSTLENVLKNPVTQ